MTTPIPAHTAMTRPPPESQQPHPPSQAAADEHDLSQTPATEGQPGQAAAPSRRTATVNWAAVGNGLLPTLLSAALLAFMIFAFTSLDNRITSQDAKIEALDAKVDEINLKLTALIAALNMTAEVDAALAGEITTNSSDASSHE